MLFRSKADVDRTEKHSLKSLRDLEAKANVLLQPHFLGIGRRRQTGARVAAKGLMDLMRRRTGKPRMGLVAAILMDAGFLRPTGCWTLAPTANASGQRRAWCRRIRIRTDGNICKRTNLRCSIATNRVKAVLKKA